MEFEPKNLKEWISLYTDKYDNLSNKEILDLDCLKLMNLNIKEISLFLNDFKGHLNLCFNQIQEIPKTFIHNGDLLLCYNQIQEIPKNFIENGKLSLIYNMVEKIHSPELLSKETLRKITNNHKKYITKRNKKDNFIDSLNS